MNNTRLLKLDTPRRPVYSLIAGLASGDRACNAEGGAA